MWLNLSPKVVNGLGRFPTETGYARECFGWPFESRRFDVMFVLREDVRTYEDKAYVAGNWEKENYYRALYLHNGGYVCRLPTGIPGAQLSECWIVANLIIGAVTVVVSCVGCEYVIRRSGSPKS